MSYFNRWREPTPLPKVIAKGDLPGHPFRGNQYMSAEEAGAGGGGGTELDTAIREGRAWSGIADAKHGFSQNVAHYAKWNKGGKHKMITKEIAGKLPRIGTTSDMDPKDVRVPLKLFNPSGAGTWYITEANLDTGEAFGYANLGDSDMAELGYMDLNELKDFRGAFGLGIERDEWWDENTTLADVMARKGA